MRGPVRLGRAAQRFRAVTLRLGAWLGRFRLCASPVRRARLPSVSGRPSEPAAPLPAPRFGPSALLTTAQQQNLAAAVVAAAVAVVVAAATAAVVAATAAAAAIVAAAPAVPAAAAAQQENQDNDPPAAPAETTIVTTTHDLVTSLDLSRSQRPARTPQSGGLRRRSRAPWSPPAARPGFLSVSASYYVGGGRSVPLRPKKAGPRRDRSHPALRQPCRGVPGPYKE